MLNGHPHRRATNEVSPPSPGCLRHGPLEGGRKAGTETLPYVAGVALLCLAILFTASPAVRSAQDESWLGVPGFPLSRLTPTDGLVEDWGAVKVILTGEGVPTEAQPSLKATIFDGFTPAAEVQSQHGPVALTVAAFRGPAWPAGVDVLVVTVRETAGRSANVTLSFDIGPNAQVGERTVSVGGRMVMGLPESPLPVRREREWGYCDEATSLPGWARPEGECDPAFRNIRAGLGGVPMLYRFVIEPKSAVQVVMGLCESHWAEAAQRPIVCKVEGAPRQEVDCIAKWGRHKPGALVFAGRDENGDGRLDVSVLPHPNAPDQNPILNVLWLFPVGQPLNLNEVIKGRLNEVALRYVDVGGQGDQSLYESGRLEYDLALPANGVQQLGFLVACPGASVPLPSRTSWTPASLRRAAAEVWGDWFAQGKEVSITSATDGPKVVQYRRALAEIALFRRQADGYFVPLSSPGGAVSFDARAFGELTGALDYAGMSAEAERNLRVLWDAPLPAPFSSLAQGQDGHWPGDAAAQAHRLLALGRHATLGASTEWCQLALPAAKRGAEWLVNARPTGEDAKLAAAALLACARLAEGCSGEGPKTAAWMKEQAKLLQPASLAETDVEPQTPQAKAVWELRSVLVQ